MKELSAKELDALNFFKDLKMIGKGAVTRRDAFIAMSGIYQNTQMADGSVADKAKPRFRDAAACVKTVVLGLDNILQETSRKDLIDITALDISSFHEVQDLVAQATTSIRQALIRDYKTEYEAANQAGTVRQMSKRR